MNRLINRLFNFTITVIFSVFTINCSSQEKPNPENEIIHLSEPKVDGSTSVEKAINERRSRRNLLEYEISLEHVSQLLWSAQGITKGDRFRTAPSAGALYPMEIYIVVGNVRDLKAGIYKYNPNLNILIRIYSGDVRKDLYKACLWQNFIEKAPLTIVISAVYERVTKKYGERGKIYVHMEAGHIGQNIYLQCESLKLGTVAVGAFLEDQVKSILKLKNDEVPIYIFPIGKYLIDD